MKRTYKFYKISGIKNIPTNLQISGTKSIPTNIRYLKPTYIIIRENIKRWISTKSKQKIKKQDIYPKHGKVSKNNKKPKNKRCHPTEILREEHNKTKTSDVSVNLGKKFFHFFSNS